MENVAEFMKAGSIGVGIGSALVDTKEAVNESYLSRLTAKVFEALYLFKSKL